MPTLDDAAIFSSGGTPRKNNPDYWGGTTSWYSASNMDTKFLCGAKPKVTKLGLKNGTRIAPKGSTLLLVRGSGLFNYIPICFADEDVAFNQDVKAIIAKPHVDPTFLHFWIESLRSVLNGHIGVTGIGAGKFDTGFLKSLPFPEIEKSEQERIAKYACSFDRKIDLNRQINTTLEAMAQAIFKDWFVDFGPTVRQAEGETDPVKILGGLISNPAKAAPIADLFPDSFNDDCLPKGWDKTSFIDFIDIIGGGTPKTSNEDYWNGDIPWFSVKDTPSGSDCFVFATEKNITPAGLKGSSAKLIEEGITIISARGTVGNLAIAGQDMTFNQSCYALKPKGTDAIYFTFLATQTVVQRLKDMAHGSVFSTITRGTFESVEFPDFPAEIIVKFEEICSPLFEKIKANAKENQTLAETRDYLLPKLMSGEVRVGEAAPAATETSNVFTMGGDLFDRKALPADKDLERDSAIVAGVVSALQRDSEVVGNVKYQKGCYFVYRRMGYSTRDFDRKAAGPYSRKIVEGGHARAVSQNYIRFKSDPNYPGNLPARNIRAANALANQYKLGDALSWVRQHLSGKSRGELELWATVDYAMVALRNRRTTPTAETIMDYIRNEPEWAAKLKKANFTKPKINAAIAELNKAFSNG